MRLLRPARSLIRHPQQARMPERRNAEHIKRVVLIVPDRRHIDVAKFVDQLRHCIAVADNEHTAAFVLVHNP
jgi:hypothetical protein